MNARHVSLIVRVDVKRRFRYFVGDSRRLAVTILAGLFMLLPLGAATAGALYFGERVGSGDFEVPLTAVGGAIGAAAGLVAVIVAIRAIQTTAVPTNADGLLIWAEHREIVVAILLLETLVPLGLFGVPAIVVGIAFATGAGAPASAVSIFAACFAVIVLGSFLGTVVGFAVRIAIARSEVLARYRTVVAILLFLGYFGVIASDESATVLGPVIDLVGATPLGWYGDLALLGAPIDVSASHAAGSLLLTVLCVVGLGLLTDRLAGMLWYETPVEPTRDVESSGMDGDLRYVPRQMVRVARKQWMRAWRSPIRLLFVAYPAFLLVAPLSRAIQTGQVPTTLPAGAVLYGAWATGAAFTLNVVGDEGNVLPVTLSTPVSGRHFVGGCCLAGIAVGVPLTAILAVSTAVLAGLTPVSLLVVTALAVALPVGATGLATGIGVLFPRRESVRVTRGREAVVPSLFAFAIYSSVLVVVAAPWTIVQADLVRDAVGGALGVTSSATLLLGTAFTVCLLAVAGGGSFRYAHAAFDDYYL